MTRTCGDRCSAASRCRPARLGMPHRQSLAVKLVKTVLLIGLLAAAPLPAQITWTKVASLPNPPYFNQWHWLRYNELNGLTMLWVADNSGGRSSIYSDSLWTFNAQTRALTRIGTNNQLASGDCVPSSATWPGSRHPVGQMFWDSKRHRLVSVEGVCGTINAFDMWYFQANNPLTNNAWTQMNPAHYPNPAHNLSSVVHDTDDDVYYLFGADVSGSAALDWIYCPTDLNPQPGTLTAAQVASNCTAPDDWTALSAVGGRAQHPLAGWMPGLIYDSVHKTIIEFGGLSANGATEYMQTWSFSLQTKTWTNMNPTGGPGVIPTPYSNWSGQPSIAFNPSDGKIYYHQPTNPPVDWTYDFGANAWTELCLCGGSPTGTTMEYDPTINGFVQWSYGGPGFYEIWVGNLTGSTAPTVLTRSPLTSGLQNTAYSLPLQAGGTQPINWAVTSGSLPPGLTLSSAGVLSGTPTQTGTVTFGVTASNSVGTSPAVSFNLTIAVPAAIVPSIPSSSSIPGATLGTPYNYAFTSNGTQPVTWSVSAGTLPPGLNFSGSGVLSGTPTSSGTYNFTITATNAAGSSSNVITLPVSGPGGTSSGGALTVPLTVQEALYPGSMAGVDRVNEPFCMGVPLPDSAGIANTSALALQGANAGQFRVLGRWPSGNAKWVETCGVVPSLAAGGSTTVTLTNSGSGNFGGVNLATDNGTTITVATGAATFTVRKAGFNGIDTAVVGSTTVVASGTSQGFVVTGPNPSAPYPGNVTCLPTAGGSACTTAYSSANDPNSTCVVEKNGPVQAVLKCDFDHKDSSGNTYMHGSARLYFNKGETAVKITSELRNADLGPSGSFASAYKGHQGYELRLTPNLGGTLNFTIANDTASPSTGTMSGSDSVYLYQGESQLMNGGCGYGCVPLTTDKGYSIVKNGSTVLTGTDTQYPQGWADLSNGNGAGVEIGVYQLSAYWPKSLEFNNGGQDVRIGILARENSQPYYQAWPQHSTQDVYLIFHDGPLVSPSNEFLKLQHYLLARASYSYYNSTGAFPYPLIDPTVEDNFYKAVQQTATPSTISSSRACCIQDYGVADPNWPLQTFRFWYWGSTGGSNQSEFRWSDILNYLTRGMAGRYLYAAHWYRYIGDGAWPRSDGFTWRGQTGLDGFGMPKTTSANAALATRWWINADTGEHAHWYGLIDYYFLSGDETIKDALLDGPKDWYLSTGTYQTGANGGMWNARAVGAELIGSARYATFLSAVGDPDASGVLAQGVSDYMTQISPSLCASGTPAGCSFGVLDGGPWTSMGVNRERGVFATVSASTGSPWCGVPHNFRVNKPFMNSILIQGILELRGASSSSWSEYWNSLDLAYGIARMNLSEMFVDDGSGRWDTNGFRYSAALDWANNCTGPGETPQGDFQPQAQQTVSMTFLAKALVDGGTDWATKFKINLQKDMVALGTNASDMESYQPAALISILNNPTVGSLASVPLTSVTDNGGGSYTLSWTVPAGAGSYRIKWSTQQIVDWVGFDNGANTWIGDPVKTIPWFAATNASGIPTPAPAGTTQTFTIQTGATGLTAANFSVKAASGSLGSVLSVGTSFSVGSSSGGTGSVGSSTPGSGTSFNVLDVNRDGVVNSLDVQAAIQQALGTNACGTADVDRDGVCNVVDVQLVVNGTLP